MAANVLSGVLHASGLVSFSPRPVTEIKGGGTGEVALLGNAFADLVAGAAPSPMVEQTLPVVPVTASAAPVAAVTPVAPAAVATPVLPIQRVEGVQDPPQNPKRRPPPAKPVAKPAHAPGAEARKGQADGIEIARDASAGRAPTAVSGNAAAASYPGTVLRNTSRTRKPKAPARGKVVVAFRIGPSGDRAAVQVAQTSGTASLDRVALDHIRAAAPFAPPPTGAKTAFRFEFVGRP
jgi:protein TonB